jgi:hypothetical protein
MLTTGRTTFLASVHSHTKPHGITYTHNAEGRNDFYRSWSAIIEMVVVVSVVWLDE